MSTVPPTLLVTNDDGIDAPGIRALEAAAVHFGRVCVVAPCGPESGCGHRVTTHEPIVLSGRGADRHSVGGTPADCVRLALHHLVPEVSWVLSWINAGGNLGADVYHSGTVAAVREAVIHGRPGIALSHYIARGKAIDWPVAALRAARVLERLLGLPCEPGCFWNVNLPHLEPGVPEPEIVFCPLDPSPLPLQYRVEDGRATYCGAYHERRRHPGCDVEVCFGGAIAVTLIRLIPAAAGGADRF